MKTIYQTAIFGESFFSKRAPNLFLCMLLFMLLYLSPVLSSAGQTQPSIILANPNYTHGYVVLQKTDARITHFVVNINKLTYSASGAFTKTPVSKIELWDLNYWRIPSEFIYQNAFIYTVEVSGVGAGGVVFDSDEQPLPMECDDCPEGEYESYECESYTTSFEIGISDLGGYGNYAVEQGNAYMWFSPEDLAGLYAGGAPGYNEIPTYGAFVTTYGAMWEVPNNPSQPGGTLHRRMDGTMIPDAFPVVYGLPKTKYEWCGLAPQAGQMQMSSLPGELANAMSAINGSSSWNCDNLYCNEMFEIEWENGSEGETDVVDELWEWLLEQWADEMELEDEDDHDIDGDVDFWDTFVHHLEAYSDGIGNPDFTISQVDYINIKGFGDDGVEQLYQYHKSDLINASGTPTPPTFTLEEGIYEIAFTVRSGGVFRFFLPVKSRLVSDFSLSSYVNMLAFPVPVVGQNFQLNIQSSANLDIRAEVLSTTGVVYYRNRYVVRAGHDQNHTIALPGNTPNGLLIVRLLFSDGSQKTITISKSS